jgi:hypothetical protein
MTTELYTPSPAYEVQGIGPYAVPHPYVAGSLTVAVILEGERIALSDADFTATPASTEGAGDITLTPARAAELDGGTLHVRRVTPVQQGWVGLLGERERGLEVQLDRMTMAVQELQDQMRGALRVDGDLDPFVMQAGRLVIADENGNPAPGPDATDIADAQTNAAAAAAAATAAADQAGTAVASAEAAAISAAAAAAAATNAIGDLIGAPFFESLSILRADMGLSYGGGGPLAVAAGDHIQTRAEGFIYRVAASDAPDHDLSTAGGVRLYVMPSCDGAYNVRAFGVVGDGVANDAPALNRAMAAAGRHVIVPPGTYLCQDTLRIRAGTHLDLHADATIVHDAPTFCLLLNGPYGDPAYALGYDGDGDLHISGGTWDMSPRTAALQLGEAIGIAHAENVLIENARFVNNHNDHFIEINSTRNCTIRNCTFDTTTASSPGTRECINIDYSFASGFPHFGGYDNTPCDGVLIDNCRFLDGDVAVGSHSAPAGAINRHQRIIVRDCVVDTMASAGIDIRYWNLRNSGIWRTQIAGVAGANEYRGLAVVDGRYVFEVADDGVAVIPLAAMFGATEASPQGVLLISAESATTQAPRGLYWARAQSGSESISRIATGGLDTSVDLTTGVLTGTTGTDGRVTLSAGGGGNFYIENRRGSSLRMTVMPAFGPTGNVA